MMQALHMSIAMADMSTRIRTKGCEVNNMRILNSVGVTLATNVATKVTPTTSLAF